MREVGTFTVNAPVAEAFELFTPLGERRWVAGWDPVFPNPTDDDTAPGTVFTTVHDGHETIWVVTERDPGVSIAYARVTPHHRAGTVRVRCMSTGPDTTRVEVEYRLTSMTGTPEPPLPAGFFRAWEDRIAEFC